MDKKEFREYVIEHKRVGLDNSQIARKLGMDPYIFEDACKFAFDETKTPPKPVKIIPEEDIKEISEKPRKEKVEGIFYVPQNDDDEFMNTPIVKKEKKAETVKDAE